MAKKKPGEGKNYLINPDDGDIIGPITQEELEAYAGFNLGGPAKKNTSKTRKASVKGGQSMAKKKAKKRPAKKKVAKKKRVAKKAKKRAVKKKRPAKKKAAKKKRPAKKKAAKKRTAKKKRTVKKKAAKKKRPAKKKAAKKKRTVKKKTAKKRTTKKKTAKKKSSRGKSIKRNPGYGTKSRTKMAKSNAWPGKPRLHSDAAKLGHALRRAGAPGYKRSYPTPSGRYPIMRNQGMMESFQAGMKALGKPEFLMDASAVAGGSVFSSVTAAFLLTGLERFTKQPIQLDTIGGQAATLGSGLLLGSLTAAFTKRPDLGKMVVLGTGGGLVAQAFKRWIMPMIPGMAPTPAPAPAATEPVPMPAPPETIPEGTSDIRQDVLIEGTIGEAGLGEFISAEGLTTSLGEDF